MRMENLNEPVASMLAVYLITAIVVGLAERLAQGASWGRVCVVSLCFPAYVVFVAMEFALSGTGDRQ
jgi:hypothetical protein